VEWVEYLGVCSDFSKGAFEVNFYVVWNPNAIKESLLHLHRCNFYTWTDSFEKCTRFKSAEEAQEHLDDAWEQEENKNPALVDNKHEPMHDFAIIECSIKDNKLTGKVISDTEDYPDFQKVFDESDSTGINMRLNDALSALSALQQARSDEEIEISKKDLREAAEDVAAGLGFELGEELK
jgi:hypothetical protein